MKKVLHYSELKLHPLRIPSGWIIRYNQLLDICPTTANQFEVEGHGGRDPWLLFGQNLLHLQDTRHGRVVLDVGWYPDSDPSGEFSVRLVIDEDWEHPHLSLDTRTLAEAVVAIETFAIKGLGLASQLD